MSLDLYFFRKKRKLDIYNWLSFCGGINNLYEYHLARQRLYLYSYILSVSYIFMPIVVYAPLCQQSSLNKEIKN